MELPKTSPKADKKCDPCRVAKQKCNPPERNWDGNTQEKCIRCTKVGDDCGPNLTQFESETTTRGRKRKAKQSLDHGSTQSDWHARNSLGILRPQSSSHNDPNTIEAAPRTVTSFATGDDNTNSEYSPRVEQHEGSVNANSVLETSNELLWYYQYINHPKQTLFFLEQDAPPQRDLAYPQKDVSSFLAWKIKDELSGVVQKIDVSHCSAEHVLLLAKEAVHRFRYLANDSEGLIQVEYEILDKRLRLTQRCFTSKERQREIMSVYSKGLLFHQQTLEMERNRLICKTKPPSRSISPEAASTPSSDRSAGSKRAMKQAGGMFFSRETANLLEDSSVKSHVSHYISSRSFAKNRRKRGKESMEFPPLHIALLFGTEEQARSWATRLESNDIDVDLVDFFKRKVAHVAAEVGRVHLLNAVLRGHRKSLDTPDAFGLTPLMIAVLHGHLECCKLLIDAGFDPVVRDSKGRNLLSIACRRGHFCIVEYLINDLGFPPSDYRGGYFCSPIHEAVESEDLRICAFLIDSGADLNQKVNNKTPADLALEKALTSISQLIQKKTAHTGWSQIDPVSAHLGYHHRLDSQYSAGDDVNQPIPQPYAHDSQSHDVASHSFNMPLYQPTAANDQYVDPHRIGHE